MTSSTATFYIIWEQGTFTLSSQAAVIVNGNTSGGQVATDKTSKFIGCSGVWQMLLNTTITRDDPGCLSLTSNKAIASRGHREPAINTPETCRYNHFMAPGKRDTGGGPTSTIFDYFNTAFCGQDKNCPLPVDKQIYIQTVNLLTQKFPVDNVLAYCGSIGFNNNPSISVSLDGGKTYKGDQANGTIINTDGLKPDTDGNYKLKLKFELPTQGESWTSKTNLISARTTMGGLFLNNDQSIVAGGLNTSSGARTAIANTDRYSSSQNTWLNRTGLGSNKWDGYFISLGWDCGLYCGGGNGVTVGGIPTGVDLQTQRYSNSQNNWIQKTDLITAVLSGSTISLTNNLGIIAGGTNSTTTWATGSTNLYSHSFNTWTVQIALVTPRYNCPGMTLTDSYGLVVAGIGSSSVGLSTCEAYQFSTGTWISKLAIDYISPSKNNFGTIDLTTDSGLISGGSNASGYDYTSIKYFYNSNHWTSRLNITKITNEPGNFGQTAYTGILAGGYNSTGLLNDSQQYFNGDLDFLGFVAIPISKK